MPQERASASSSTASMTHCLSLSLYDGHLSPLLLSSLVDSALTRVASSRRFTHAAARSSSAVGTTIPGSLARVIHAHTNAHTAVTKIALCQIHRRSPNSSFVASSRALSSSPIHSAIDALAASEAKATMHSARERHAARSLALARERDAREASMSTVRQPVRRTRRTNRRRRPHCDARER